MTHDEADVQGEAFLKRDNIKQAGISPPFRKIAEEIEADALA